MGKRCHGKKRNKKIAEDSEKDIPQPQETPKNDSKEIIEQNTTPSNEKVILDKRYKGDLRSVTISIIVQDNITLKDIAWNITYLDGEVFELISIERLKKKKGDAGKFIFLPSNTYKLTFKGHNIPSKIKLGSKVVECKPFWNFVIQCRKCLRYRHLSTTCKGYAQCNKCGCRKEADHKCETDELKCANCKGEHDAFDNSCPVYIFQKRINLIRAQDNTDYKTAVEKYSEEEKAKKILEQEEAKKILEQEKAKKMLEEEMTRKVGTSLAENVIEELDGMLTFKVTEDIKKDMEKISKKLSDLQAKVKLMANL